MGNTVSDATTFSWGTTTYPNSTITQSLREHPPSSYSLKIENLIQLNGEKYESRRFTVGGYDWRLIIYPKGNNEDNGSGFISMYVEIDSTSEVFAYLKFFLYNKKEQKYFTIQDTEVKRFNALRMVWGLSHVLPLYLFNDPKNGYIFEGHKCEFGVDVMVVPPLTNWEVVSFNQELCNPKFSFTLKNFTDLKKDYVSSNFLMGGKKWVLKLYPKGMCRADGKWLSLFLHVAENETLNVDEKIFMQAHLRVIDPHGGNNFTRKLNSCYKKSETSWGWDQFVSIAILQQAYLNEEGSLKVEIECEVVSTTKYSLP